MIAIIDGDVLAYSSCETRYEVPMNGTVKIELDENGRRKELVFSKQEDRKYLEKCWDKFQKNFQSLLDELWCTEYLMAVKAPGREGVPDNYRNIMYSEYKMNRHKDPTKANKFVPVLRELATAEGMAVPAAGREADDLMRIWAEEARRDGDEYIICSIDKDLMCIPGKHYRMPVRDWMGNIKSGGNTIEVSEEEAMRFYFEQLLKGDATDNIPGIPGVGPVKATKALAHCKTVEEFQESVVEQYFGFYGEKDWYNQLLSNGKMIYLQKHANDFFSIRDWPIVQELIS